MWGRSDNGRRYPIETLVDNPDPGTASEVVLHLGRRGAGHLTERRGIYPEIMVRMAETGLSPRAVLSNKAGRKAAKNDQRRHLFFHGRMEGPRFLNFKESYLKGFYYCDPKGFSGFSTIADQSFDPAIISAASAESFHASLSAELIERRASKHRQTMDVTPVPEGAIAVFLQVQDDVVLKLAHFGTKDMLTALLAQRGKQPLVIKRHPLCKDPEISETLASLHDPAAGIVVTDGNIHDILANASHVAVINSGAGFEALLHNRPVLLFGKSDYHHAAYSIISESDIETALRQSAPPVPADRYLYWFLRHQMISPRFGSLGRQILQRFSVLH